MCASPAPPVDHGDTTMNLLRTSLFLSVAIVCGFAPTERASGALPQLTLILPPTAPVLRSPAAGATVEVNFSDARPTFVWRHGGLYFGYPRPATPTHFAICIYAAANPITCSWSLSAWQPAVGSVPSVPTGIQSGQFDYTYQLPTAVSSSLLDTPLRWSVGACVVASTGATCTFSAPADLWLSTKNLRGDSSSEGISASSSRGRNLWFEGNVTNTGTTQIASVFGTQFDLFNTLMTSGETCVTDPNDPSVMATDQVITTHGHYVTVSTLALDGRGRRLPPSDGVAAVLRPGSWHYGPWGSVYGDLPAGATRTIFSFGVTAPSPLPVPSAYTVVMIPDVGNSVREFNENDNAKAQCHVIH
jgi:hypothetical protein